MAAHFFLTLTIFIAFGGLLPFEGRLPDLEDFVGLLTGHKNV
jgi:hypothetical protein